MLIPRIWFTGFGSSLLTFSLQLTEQVPFPSWTIAMGLTHPLPPAWDTVVAWECLFESCEAEGAMGAGRGGSY